jgi:AAA family ATP:ADP antiporter
MPERQPSPLDRFLRLFTDVRPGEGATAIMLALNVFLILLAYYVLKVLRSPLIHAVNVPWLKGAELPSVMSAVQALLLVMLVPAYGALANRYPRRRLINVVTGFFVACLALFYLAHLLKLSIGIAFYVWVGIFNMMVVAQFWAFANDIYTTDEGKRLFPMVAFGASLGAVAGTGAVVALTKPLGLYPLLLVAAAILAVATLLTNAIDARERRRTEAALPDPMTSGTLPAATGQYRAATGEFKEAGDAYRKESGHFGIVRPGAASQPAPAHRGTFRLVFQSRYLLLIALLVLLLNWVNSTGETILNDALFRAADDAVATGRAGGLDAGVWIARYQAAYQGGASILAVLLNLFVVGRVLKWFGVRAAILVLPCIALGGYALLTFAPILAAMRWVKTAENATDYSINKTASNVLFLPTTRQEKYKGKQVIDAFVVRMGDVLSAALILFGTHVLKVQIRQLAVVNLALVVVWIVLAVFIGRRYERLAAATAS